MIRVHKSDTVPESLSRTKAYDGEDVKIQLYADQLDKCYICERVRDTDTHIEHCVSRNANGELVQFNPKTTNSCSKKQTVMAVQFYLFPRVLKSGEKPKLLSILFSRKGDHKNLCSRMK